jgi:DNA adenine methylase
MTSSSVPFRQALRYHGSKWRLAPWLISHFPEHECYCEPFAGACSVLLRKVPARFECVNDLDSEIVNFFRVLRERPGELIQQIKLTPWSREEQLLAFEAAPNDPLERARRLYVRSWQTRGGPRTQWHSGWRFHFRLTRMAPPNTLKHWQETAHLQTVAQRLLNVQIEHDDAIKVIKRFDAPGTLFYVDPPYLAHTRSQRWGEHAYIHEMTEQQHLELSEVLHNIAGMAVISGYISPLYTELYGDWSVFSKNTVNERAGPSVEYIWISPAAAERQQHVLELDWFSPALNKRSVSDA